MGDRANVYIKGYKGEPGVYLYTHWSGTDLPETVQRALARQERWDDHAYLARIVFCEMVKGFEADETGFGISAGICDGGGRILVLDPDTQEMSIDGNSMPFKEYVVLANPSWDLAPKADPNGPLTADQRRALFALFDEVFTSRRNGARYIFTNTVLGNDPNTIVSWSEWKQGSLTFNQASKVLDALTALRDAL